MRLELTYTNVEEDSDMAVVGLSYAIDNYAGDDVQKAGSIVISKIALNSLVMGLRMAFPSYVPKRPVEKSWKIIGFIIKSKL